MFTDDELKAVAEDERVWANKMAELDTQEFYRLQQEERVATEQKELSSMRKESLSGQFDPIDVQGEVDKLEKANEEQMASNPPWYEPFRALFTGTKMRPSEQGRTKKDIMGEVAKEVINDPRYDDAFSDESGLVDPITSKAASVHILKKAELYNSRMQYRDGLAQEHVDEGYSAKEAFTMATEAADKLFGAAETYSPSRLEEATAMAQEGHNAEAILHIASDPYVIVPALIAWPFATAGIMAEAGLKGTGLISGMFSELGGTVLATSMAGSAASSAAYYQLDDELAEHPYISMATGLAAGIGEGKLIYKLERAFSKSLKEANYDSKMVSTLARRYAERSFANMAREGKVGPTSRKVLDEVLDSVYNIGESQSRATGKDIDSILEAQLVNRNMITDPIKLGILTSEVTEAKRAASVLKSSHLKLQQAADDASSRVSQVKDLPDDTQGKDTLLSIKTEDWVQKRDAADEALELSRVAEARQLSAERRLKAFSSGTGEATPPGKVISSGMEGDVIDAAIPSKPISMLALDSESAVMDHFGATIESHLASITDDKILKDSARTIVKDLISAVRAQSSTYKMTEASTELTDTKIIKLLDNAMARLKKGE